MRTNLWILLGLAIFWAVVATLIVWLSVRP